MKNIDSKNYAGFWIRSLAFAADLSIFVLPTALLITSSILLSLWFQLPGKYLGPKYIYLYFAIIYLVILPYYFTRQHCGNKQSTIGKRACNLYVGKKSDGSKINLFQAIGRYIFVGILPPLTKYYNLVLYALSSLSLYMAALTPQKTALHDIIFKTRVFKGTPNEDGMKQIRSYYITFTTLLILLGTFLPLYTHKNTYFIWAVILAYIFLLSIVLIYYKTNVPDVYEQYSFIRSLNSQKVFFIALIPSIICFALTYSIIIYVKIKPS